MNVHYSSHPLTLNVIKYSVFSSIRMCNHFFAIGFRKIHLCVIVIALMFCDSNILFLYNHTLKH